MEIIDNIHNIMWYKTRFHLTNFFPLEIPFPFLPIVSIEIIQLFE